MLGEDENLSDARAFNSKSVWARMAVIFAGPFMNFVLAFATIFVLLSGGIYLIPQVSEVIANMGAETAGLQKGDQIVQINGYSVATSQDLAMALQGADGSPIAVKVKRDGQVKEFMVTPERAPEAGGYILGINQTLQQGMFAKPMEGVEAEKAGILDVLSMSYHTMVSYIRMTVSGFIQLITMQVSTEDVAGPIGIVKVIGESYEAGLEKSVWGAMQNLLSLGALLSANLGAVNLFPIPALDGGRLLFLLIEALRGKPINAEKEGMVHFAGFLLLIAFMVFIAYQDIIKLIIK